MLIPIFTLKLNSKIYPRLVTLGKYDGVHPCLTAAATAGKVFVHDPHGRRARVSGSRATSTGADSDVYLLNINQQVTALCAGNLLPEVATRDALFVGSQTNLLAYDVDRNSDLFYRETPDGVNALVVGAVGKRPAVIAGGNCSLLGFDYDGDETYWTVTGDNVASLALVDFDNDDDLELVVGSDDYNIRVFKGADMISELDEMDAVTSLCSVNPMGRGSRFGYGLANGTVGVYDRTARYWRIKSKNQAIALHAFDIDADGVPELIIGWSNGKVDARNSRTSEVVFKDTFPAVIAGLVSADYRMDGKEELIICAADGEVRGFLPTLHSSQRVQLGSAAHAAAAASTGAAATVSLEQEKFRELQEKRQQLLVELQNYEANIVAGRTAKATELSGPVVDVGGGKQLGVIPANTQLRTGLTLVAGDEHMPPYVQLSISTSNDMIVRSVMVFAEGLFAEGESFVAHPPASALDTEISIPITPPKDEPVDLHIKALVGHRSSTQFHVFELARQLPRFSLYILAPSADVPDAAESSVSFQVNERVNRVTMWINQSFLLLDPLQPVGSSQLDVAFVSLRDNAPLRIRMNGNQMTIETESMDLAGDVIQALAAFLGIVDLQVVADFPREMNRLGEILVSVDEYHASRQKLSAEMADHSNLIRSLVVRAEDARLLGDVSGMMKGYTQLYDLNRDLVTGYKLRCTNHMELLSQLRCVNQYIQRAGRLRVGKYKTQVIGACRAAIKANNVEGLFKIIKVGSLS